MAIQIVPHEARFSASVDAFNQRMRAGGSKWGFYTDPEPDWIPKTEGAKSWREYYLAVEDGEVVRGGYALKPQQWLINGSIRWVTDWQGPFTEAAVDPKFSPLMLRILRGMQKQYPLLFSLGHGGTEEPIVELLRRMNWTLWEVPFCFYVFKPYRFLRRNAYLRNTPARRLALDLMAASGVGAVGIRSLQAATRLRSAPPSAGAVAVEVNRFEDWADDLWLAHKDKYRCIAVRDSEMMNALMPPRGWPGGTRLKIERGGEVIGWSVVHARQMTDDPRFGNLNVALLTDCFGAPEDSKDIVGATFQYIRSLGVDLAFANICHPAWVEGLRSAGFTILPGRRMFAVSPDLARELCPAEQVRAGLHLTNMDGHGPHGFQ